jgi:hypothetical protein
MQVRLKIEGLNSGLNQGQISRLAEISDLNDRLEPNPDELSPEQQRTWDNQNICNRFVRTSPQTTKMNGFLHSSYSEHIAWKFPATASE